MDLDVNTLQFIQTIMREHQMEYETMKNNLRNDDILNREYYRFIIFENKIFEYMRLQDEIQQLINMAKKGEQQNEK